MKVTQSGVPTVSSGTLKAPANSIEFNSMHNGQYRAVVPLILPGYGTDKRMIVAVPVVFESETQENKKAKTRMMLKCTMPYKAIRKDAALLTTPEYYDSTRSGGEISCHVVVSVAKSVKDDLQGQNGAQCQLNAASQIGAVVKMTLASLGGWATAPTTVVADTVNSGVETAKPADIQSTGVEIYSSAAVLIQSLNEASPSIKVTPIESYDNMMGLDLSDTVPNLGTLLNSPLARGLYGFAPLDEQGEIVIPKSFLYADEA